LASLGAYEEADLKRIKMWGRSMRGQITLRAVVVSGDIKAGVIWAGDIVNISINLGVAMQRSVAFFDRYVKDESE
jgi:dienelactone hydrolase